MITTTSVVVPSTSTTPPTVASSKKKRGTPKGGSDLVSAALAAALKAGTIELYKNPNLELFVSGHHSGAREHALSMPVTAEQNDVAFGILMSDATSHMAKDHAQGARITFKQGWAQQWFVVDLFNKFRTLCWSAEPKIHLVRVKNPDDSTSITPEVKSYGFTT